MAKVSGPLMSMDASGTLGKAITFSKWKGVPVVRQYVVPANPNTIAQQAVRNSFTAASDAFKALDATNKAALNRSASGMAMSGYNYLMKVICNALKSGLNWMAISITGTASTNNSITVSLAAGVTKKVMVEYGTKPGVYTASFTEADVPANGDARNVVINGLLALTTYYFRVKLVDGLNVDAGETGEFVKATV